MTAVGVIGVGELGSRLARRLRGGGYQVLVHDIDRHALANVSADDVTVAATVAELTERSDVVLTCVTDQHAVRDVCLGADGVVATARPGTVLVDTTTSLPGVSEAVAAALAERGGYMLDAPVSRGVPAAESGTLSAMVGGSTETFQAALPVLRTFATDIALVGDVGAGHAVKLWNMQLMATHQHALTAALWRARGDGVSAATAVAAFQDGRARTYLTSNHIPKFVLSGTYHSRFTVGLMRKDLALSVQLGGELGVSAPVAEETLTSYDRACDAGLGHDDNMRLLPFQWALLSGASVTDAVSAARMATGPPDATGERTDEAYLEAADAELAQSNEAALMEVLAAVAAYGMRPETALAMIDASSGTSYHVAAVLNARAGAAGTGSARGVGS